MERDIPRLLAQARSGDALALNEMVAGLYDELHRIAGRHLRSERSEHTLQPTALVHETYLKLVGRTRGEFADRVHFLALASRVMRQVLVDYARARTTKKRSGAAPDAVSLSARVGDAEQVEFLALDGALDALSQEDSRLAQLIEMRYFGGMTAEESADALGESVHVVRHDLRFATAWLRRKLSE